MKHLIVPPKRQPTVDPEISKKYINVSALASSIEKAHRTLNICIHNGNQDAIDTWVRICAALQMKWRDALVEIQTNGHYTFE
jgi:hypothetical protein